MAVVIINHENFEYIASKFLLMVQKSLTTTGAMYETLKKIMGDFNLPVPQLGFSLSGVLVAINIPKPHR